MEKVVQDLLDNLDLPFEGEWVQKEYVITLDNSDDFSQLYNLISTDSTFNLDDNSMSTGNNAVFIFYTDDCELRFTSDFEQDVYRLTISRR
jgi:hypothetical protein